MGPCPGCRACDKRNLVGRPHCFSLLAVLPKAARRIMPAAFRKDEILPAVSACALSLLASTTATIIS